MSGGRPAVSVSFVVTVDIDPSDEELLDRFDASNGQFSIREVVRQEIESNLESVSYVRCVSVKPK